MVVRFYSSVAPETTLSAGITNASTSITVGSVTGFPASTPYTLALDYEGLTEELVQVNSAAGTTLTITRAVDGTSAASHNAGARVRHVSSARDFADSRSHENTGNGVHGLLPGEVIAGTTSVQTLTNKTLTSPVINSATVNGTLAGSPTFTGTWTGDVAAKIRLNNTTDASPSSTNHAFQLGPDSGVNLRLDGNEIMSVNNGAANALFINADGGNLTSFGNVGVDSVATTYTVNGIVDTNLLQVGRTAATSTAAQFKADGDANQRFTMQANGQLNWGSGTVAPDTNLFRETNNLLRTNDGLQVDLNLSVLGNSVATSMSTPTLTVGSASNTGTGIAYQPVQSAIVPISFTTQTSFSQVVNFPIAFSGTPSVCVNIASGGGETTRWMSRAISVSSTQFTIFVFRGDATDGAQTWVNVPVHWTATQI